MRTHHEALIIAGLIAALNFAGCGGGGGGGGGRAGATSALAGTVATGSPVAGATVTIKDRQGAARTATTAANGTYTADVTGLTPPFLIRATPASSGGDLFSIGTGQSSTVNVTPITDLIVKSYYEAQGLSLGAEFASAQGPNIAPTPIEVTSISNGLRGQMGRWLQAQQLDASAFDLVSTPFVAATTAATGFDAILQNTTIVPIRVGQSVLRITDGTSTTSCTVTSGSVDFATRTSAGAAASGVVDSVPILSAADQAELNLAAASVLDLFRQFAAVIAAKGQSLAAADVDFLLDANFLARGKSRADQLADVVRGLPGATLSDFRVEKLIAFSRANQVAEIVISFQITQGGVTHRETTDTPEGFRNLKKQADGSYKFFGNQQYAVIQVRPEVVGTYTGNPASLTVRFGLNPQVDAPTGRLESVTFTGVIPPTATAQTVTLLKNQFGAFGSKDEFRLPPAFDAIPFLPPAGTVYTFQITPSATSVFLPTTVTVTTRSTTNEFIQITKFDNGTTSGPPASFPHNLSAVKGKTVTVTWTLPTTFAIRQVGLLTLIQEASGTSEIFDDRKFAFSTASVTIPTIGPRGGAVIGVSFGVNVQGVNGEQTNVGEIFN